MNMITYEQVKMALSNPPSIELVNLYNDIEEEISEHELCIKGRNPFDRLSNNGSFCISATSIQSNYVAFVLGKHSDSVFPEDVMKLFFNISAEFKIQFGEIGGQQIDGCIYLIHQEMKVFSLQKVYEDIYIE